MLRILLCLTYLSLLGATAEAQDEKASEKPASQPVTEDRFEIRNMEGWTVYTNRELLAQHPEETTRTLEHLRWELYQIKLAASVRCVS